VAGVQSGKPHLDPAGPTGAGRCLLLEVDEPGAAYGPTDDLTDLQQAVGRAHRQGVHRTGDAVAVVAGRYPKQNCVD
jgi:hypothetical protein